MSKLLLWKRRVIRAIELRKNLIADLEKRLSYGKGELAALKEIKNDHSRPL